MLLGSQSFDAFLRRLTWNIERFRFERNSDPQLKGFVSEIANDSRILKKLKKKYVGNLKFEFQLKKN